MPVFSLPAGVPFLPSGYLFGPPPLLETDAFVPQAPHAQWGIFLNGQPVIVGAPAGQPGSAAAQTVVSFEIRRDWLVADFPLEQGAFAAYDKVQVPWDIRLSFATGDSDAARLALLNAVETAAADVVNMYDVYTPERSYLSCSVRHYNYRRTARNGVGLLTIDVWLVQLVVLAAAQFSNTASASGADPVSGGAVATQAPTSTQAASIAT